MKTEIRFFSGRRISEKSLRDRLKVPQLPFRKKWMILMVSRLRESGKENPEKRIRERES